MSKNCDWWTSYCVAKFTKAANINWMAEIVNINGGKFDFDLMWMRNESKDLIRWWIIFFKMADNIIQDGG